ncbi:hypothetical protein H0H93_003805, partial [Arthromyces matolae]
YKHRVSIFNLYGTRNRAYLGPTLSTQPHDLLSPDPYRYLLTQSPRPADFPAVRSMFNVHVQFTPPDFLSAHP